MWNSPCFIFRSFCRRAVNLTMLGDCFCFPTSFFFGGFLLIQIQNMHLSSYPAVTWFFVIFDASFHLLFWMMARKFVVWVGLSLTVGNRTIPLFLSFWRSIIRWSNSRLSRFFVSSPHFLSIIDCSPQLLCFVLWKGEHLESLHHTIHVFAGVLLATLQSLRRFDRSCGLAPCRFPVLLGSLPLFPLIDSILRYVISFRRLLSPPCPLVAEAAWFLCPVGLPRKQF